MFLAWEEGHEGGVHNYKAHNIRIPARNKLSPPPSTKQSFGSNLTRKWASYHSCPKLKIINETLIYILFDMVFTHRPTCYRLPNWESTLW